MTCHTSFQPDSIALQDGKDEVAVKVIDRNCLKQDPKLKENLEREIKILKLLRGHEYVVQILDAKVSL